MKGLFVGHRRRCEHIRASDDVHQGDHLRGEIGKKEAVGTYGQRTNGRRRHDLLQDASSLKMAHTDGTILAADSE